MRKRTGRQWAAAAGLTAAMLGGSAAQAAVTYDFRWYAHDEPGAELLGSFSFTTADFIDARTELTPDQLDSCTVGVIAASCAGVALDPDSQNYDPLLGGDAYDVVVFDYDQMIPSRIPAMAASGRGVREMSDVHWFDEGAFRTVGVHQQIRSDYISVLTVSGAPDAGGVPEPSTWALMIAGFGLAGTGLRRRRLAVA